MVRESSGASTERRCSVSTFWSPKPVMSHNTSYSGTSAKPNAKAPSANTRSFSVRFRFSFDFRAAFLMSSSPRHRHHDERDVERQRDAAQDDGGAAHFRAPLGQFLG